MRTRWRLALAALIMALEGMMATAAPAATFVYVGNTENNEIYVLQLDRREGVLTPVEKVSIPGVT